MRPTVAFAPMDQFFSVINSSQWTEFDIRIHTFFDNRTDRVFTDRISTDVDAMQVTTGTGNEETVIITQPNTGQFFHITLFMQAGPISHTYCLVFECLRIDLFVRVVTHVKQIQMTDRSFLFTRHLVFISL